MGCDMFQSHPGQAGHIIGNSLMTGYQGKGHLAQNKERVLLFYTMHYKLDPKLF